MSFPIQLTASTRRQALGRFSSPPGAEVPEKILQEYFIDECKALSRSTKLVVEDTHYIPLLATRKPDFAFIQKGSPLNALYVVAVGEIGKCAGNRFSNADIGHAMSFGEKLLQIQPRRAYVYVVLTDCKVICIYKVKKNDRNTHDNIRFSYEYTTPYKLTYETRGLPPPGWQHLVTIMECSPDQLGWIESSLNFGSDTVTLVRPISTGRTSIVYEGKLNDGISVVAKIAKSDKYWSCFEKEKTALEALSNPLLNNEGILVTAPLCTKVNNLRKEDIGNIINTLKILHSKFNLVHMDIRKYNFLRNDKGDILIIDWGYSATIDETGPFAGALECMPNDILASLADGVQITYSGRIDLICLAKAFYLMLHKPPNVERISFGTSHNISSRAQNILAFWESNAESELWNKIFQDAEGLKYDSLIQELEKIF
ncbi:5303_t:CDS:2 [Acaulospora colombiana]|uniref:5303_t:CDS:1 n=1 Tax=Acaulospora colombiana TaxID=27376 RepID=A0ACA9MQW1_9GLOM|nr:5303_t:CDS:2 [Acaulospora colombiana]